MTPLLQCLSTALQPEGPRGGRAASPQGARHGLHADGRFSLAGSGAPRTSRLWLARRRRPWGDLLAVARGSCRPALVSLQLRWSESLTESVQVVRPAGWAPRPQLSHLWRLFSPLTLASQPQPEGGQLLHCLQTSLHGPPAPRLCPPPTCAPPAPRLCVAPAPLPASPSRCRAPS